LENTGDPDLALAEAVASSPQGRLATGKDVAQAILFLASDQSSHVTGVTLPVDGGLTI
jgi:NAD(P)-dependent dehydrogenase (short-subunit alcohol dehydrogenase family)